MQNQYRLLKDKKTYPWACRIIDPVFIHIPAVYLLFHCIKRNDIQYPEYCFAISNLC